MSNQTLVIPTASATAEESAPRAELRALVEQVENCKATTIQIYTRSRYLISNWDRWETWASNGWRTTAKKSVKHADLWQRLAAASVGKSINFHAGEPVRIVVLGAERTTQTMRQFASLIVSTAAAEGWQLVTSDKPGFQRELIAQASKQGVGVIQPRTIGEVFGLSPARAYAAFTEKDKQADPRLSIIRQHMPTHVLTF